MATPYGTTAQADGPKVIAGTNPLTVMPQPYYATYQGIPNQYGQHQNWTQENLKIMQEQFGQVWNHLQQRPFDAGPIAQGPIATSHGVPDVMQDQAIIYEQTDEVVKRYMQDTSTHRVLFPLKAAQGITDYIIYQDMIVGTAEDTPEHAPSTNVADRPYTRKLQLRRVAKHYTFNTNLQALPNPANLRAELERKKNAIRIAFMERERAMVMEALLRKTVPFENRYASRMAWDATKMTPNERACKMYNIFCQLSFSFDRENWPLKKIMAAAVNAGMINYDRAMIATEEGAFQGDKNVDKTELEWWLNGRTGSTRFQTEPAYVDHNNRQQTIGLIGIKPSRDMYYSLNENRKDPNGGFNSRFSFSTFYKESDLGEENGTKFSHKIANFESKNFEHPSIRRDDPDMEDVRGQGANGGNPQRVISIGTNTSNEDESESEILTEDKPWVLVRYNMTLAVVNAVFIDSPQNDPIGYHSIFAPNCTVSRDAGIEMAKADFNVYMGTHLGHEECVSLLPPQKIRGLVRNGDIPYRRQIPVIKLKRGRFVGNFDPKQDSMFWTPLGTSADDDAMVYEETSGMLMKTKNLVAATRGNSQLARIFRAMRCPVTQGTIYDQNNKLVKATNGPLGNLDSINRVGFCQSPFAQPPNSRVQEAGFP